MDINGFEPIEIGIRIGVVNAKIIKRNNSDKN